MDNPAKKTGQRLRLGVVGCGRVFELYHLPALRRSLDWDLVAVCEPLPERRTWLQQIYPGASTVESFSHFLKEFALDGVLITTPPMTHCQLTIQALEAGLPVLVEKPMSLTTSEADLMLNTSRRTQQQLWVGFNRRFRRPYLNLRKKLVEISVETIQSIHFELVLPSNKWKSVTPYLGKEIEGGGVLDDVASHQLDLLTWLFGQRVVEVEVAHFANEARGLKGIEYKVKLENGLVTNCVARHDSGYVENLVIQLKDRTLLAYPSGVLEMQWLPLRWGISYSQFRTTLHLIFHKLTQKPNVTLESFERQLAAFALAIRDGESPFSGADAQSGVHSMQALQACRESLQAGGERRAPILEGEKIL